MLVSNFRAFNIRRANRTDARAIRRLLDENWAVHTRIISSYIQDKLDEYVAFLAEDRTSVRGFLMLEPQPPNSSLLVATAVHDNIKVLPMLEALFPPAELALQAQNIKSIMQIGVAPWLTRELPKLGFVIKDHIITFEWYQNPLPQIRPHPRLQIRSARLDDLPALLALDELAFGPMWHKPRTAFREALSRAVSFAVGVIGDELVAYEWCDQFGDRAHLTRLATHPDYEGMGIGTQILHYALQTLTQFNVKVVSLNTQKNNLRSQELYQRFGFKRTPEEIGVYWKELAT